MITLCADAEDLQRAVLKVFRGEIGYEEVKFCKPSAGVHVDYMGMYKVNNCRNCTILTIRRE